ncbi:tRNA lysidine(34) synthetase TilS [Breznakiellaceae bacterium SP9]
MFHRDSLFENTIAEQLKKYAVAGSFLAAVSGGADSSALLVCLSKLRAVLRFTLYCVHVEHGIRSEAESKGDARAVLELCDNLSVPCRIYTIKQGKIARLAKALGIGIEASARYFRYRALHKERLRVNAGYILTAHTKDDFLELMLMRFLKGSGPAGLKGIPFENASFIRPMLSLSRQDVCDYLLAHKVCFQTDSSNQDTRYLRNRVRLKLIPLLNECFPHWQAPVLSLAQTQALSADYLQSQAKQNIPWESESGLSVAAGVFFASHQIVREEALFQGINQIVKQAAADGAPKRANIRRFAQGTLKTVDLQTAVLKNTAGRISIKRKEQAVFQHTVSMLIKKTGYYTLDKRCSFFIREWDTRRSRIGIGGFFFAGLPLVLLKSIGLPPEIPRHVLGSLPFSKYTIIINLVDMKGLCACIGAQRGIYSVLWHRDMAGAFCFEIREQRF